MILIGSIFLFYTVFDQKATPQKNSIDPIVSKDGVYKLYGQEVTSKEVDKALKTANLVSQNSGVEDEPNKEEIVQAIATQKLLLEEASLQEISVDDDEVDEYIKTNKEIFHMSDDDYTQKLKESGMTEEEYKIELKQQIKIAKLITESIDPKDYKVTDTEVNAFIESQKEEYGDLFDGEEEALQVLKDRIKFQMELKKKNDLLIEYIDKLKRA